MFAHDRGKLVITLAGVAFAVTLVFVQVGLLRGLLKNATITIDRADADLWITSKNTPNVDFPHYFSDGYVNRVRSVPGVARADNLMVVFVGMQLPTGAEETLLVYGLEDPAAWHLPWAVSEGSVDSIRRGRTMMLDESSVRRFGPFRVGERRELFGQRIDIVGRTKEALSFTTMPIAFTSMNVAQDLEPNLYSGRTAYVLVKLAPGARAASGAAEIRRRLPYNDVYTREDWSERTRRYWVVSTGLGLNMALTVFLGVLVGVTVVAQTLYAATLDHTRDFGTLKAIGATSGHVCGLVATQAAVAGVIGYLLALPVVAGLRAGASQLGVEIIVTPSFAALLFAGSLLLCLGASLLTFRRIVSIDPALVFRT
jgi:putative ABC transport system permease protein